MKKIGVLTYHRVINDGAILQAYSLVKALSASLQNVEVEIVDCSHWGPELVDLKQILFSKRPDILWGKLLRYIKFKKILKKKLGSSKWSLLTNDYRKLPSDKLNTYDVLVVGSDEVWKVSRSSFMGFPFPNIYWLPYKTRAKKVSFAAASSTTRFSELKHNEKEFISKALKDFDLISVRDNNTLRLVNEAGVTDQEKVFKIPDPTFKYVLTGSNLKPLLTKKGVDLAKPLVGLLLANRKLSKLVTEYFRGKGYQIISLSYNNDFADVNLAGVLDPFQWAEVFGYFSFCVTNRFHGAIFCLKHKIPFLGVEDIVKEDDVETKLQCLLNDFKLNDCYVLPNQIKTLDSLGHVVESVSKNYSSDKVTSIERDMQSRIDTYILKIKALIDG